MIPEIDSQYGFTWSGIGVTTKVYCPVLSDTSFRKKKTMQFDGHIVLAYTKGRALGNTFFGVSLRSESFSTLVCSMTRGWKGETKQNISGFQASNALWGLDSWLWISSIERRMFFFLSLRLLVCVSFCLLGSLSFIFLCLSKTQTFCPRSRETKRPAKKEETEGQTLGVKSTTCGASQSDCEPYSVAEKEREILSQEDSQNTFCVSLVHQQSQDSHTYIHVEWKAWLHERRTYQEQREWRRHVWHSISDWKERPQIQNQEKDSSRMKEEARQVNVEYK
jgi:hypothetical protein